MAALLNQMIIYVTALMEAKSAMEVIVAAPTAGACATFPGALLATHRRVEATMKTRARALLTGGSSACSSRTGRASPQRWEGARPRPALVLRWQLQHWSSWAGGSARRSLSAASQALQNVLGLICDPVGNRVEAPCLGRNVAGQPTR